MSQVPLRGLHATTLLSFTFHVDANGLLACLVKASIDEVMSIQTLASPGATRRPLLYQVLIPGQRHTQIAIPPSSHL